MSPLRRLIHEIHHRSLWQVLGIFLAASWGVLQVVEVITETVGLPDWTPSMAFVLLLLGLPVCLATAFVQEGMPGQPDDTSADDVASDPGPAEVEDNLAPGTGSLDKRSARPSGPRRLLTWRNAIMGGLGAFTLLGISLVAYFVMWTSGIGPVGNLVAQGVIEEGERVVLASFDDGTDEGLGDVVTEALRVDLSEASVLDLVESVDVAAVLARMQTPAGTRLDRQLALEVAQRDGIKAVIDGDVGAAGAGYVVTATLRAAADGRSIASFRVTAEGPDDVIASIDRLSQDIREKSGETLRSIRTGEELERVTTRSLAALRVYTESETAWDLGDDARALELLDEAVTLDPAFAMAWRRKGALLNNLGTDPAEQRHAAIQAFEHRDRLTPIERYLAEGYYYFQVEFDRTKTISAYQNALRLDPAERAALNNLANVYSDIEDLERAKTLYRQAIDGPGRSNTAYQNLVRQMIGSADFVGARAVYDEYVDAYPGDAGLYEIDFWTAFVNGDLEGARSAVEPRSSDPALPAFVRADALDKLAILAYEVGQLDEGRRLMLAAERAGSEVGPGYAFGRLNWSAFSEFAVGDEDWARERVTRPLDDGTFDGLGPFERAHFFYALNLSLVGERERTERVLADYEAVTPAAERGMSYRSDVDRTRLYSRAATGDASGGVARMGEIAAAYGCATCYRAEEAWVAEREGDLARAIELHEGVRQGGFTFFELNGPYRLRSTLILGPLYEEVGDTAKAIEAYWRVVDLWEGGDIRGMRSVREAQDAIARLGG